MKRGTLVISIAGLVLGLGGLLYLLLAPAPRPVEPTMATGAAEEARTAPAAPTPAAPVSTAERPRAAPPPLTHPPAPVLRTLFGHVTNPDGDPVAGATVRLVIGGGRPDRTARADADGAFRLDRVPDDAERLEFSARGYAPRRFERPRFPDAPRVRWDVELEPAAGIHGIVLVGEQPAADAWVSVRRRGRRGRPLAATRTDGSGRFALDPVAGDAPLTVAAFHGQHGSATVDVEGPGEVTLRLPGGGFIEGRVVDAEGDPVQSFTVSASPLARGAGGPPAQSFEAGDGAFRLGPVAPGKVDVWAVAEGYQPGEARRVEVTAGETRGGVVLTLKRSAELRGRVTDARTGRPIAGAFVVPAEWRSGALAESVGAITGPDGRYVLRALPGERTSIHVRADGYRPLLVGGIEGAPGAVVKRDFALSMQPRNAAPASELTGIGAVLESHPRGVALRSIIDGGPAAEVLEAGDVVVMVDGQRVGAGDIGMAAQAIRGEIGTEVQLWVLRGGQGEPERVVLRRDRVVLPDPHHRRRRDDVGNN